MTCNSQVKLIQPVSLMTIGNVLSITKTWGSKDLLDLSLPIGVRTEAIQGQLVETATAAAVAWFVVMMFCLRRWSSGVLIIESSSIRTVPSRRSQLWWMGTGKAGCGSRALWLDIASSGWSQASARIAHPGELRRHDVPLRIERLRPRRHAPAHHGSTSEARNECCCASHV